MLSLVKLYIRSWWAQLMGGKQKHLALFGLRKPIEDGLPDAAQAGGLDGVGGAPDRRPGIEDEDLDLVEWARARERDELEDAYDDYLETGRTARRQSRLETEAGDAADGDLWETIAIALLVVGFSSLMWFRGRMARRREEREIADRRARDQLAELHNNQRTRDELVEVQRPTEEEIAADTERRENPIVRTEFTPTPPVP
jgi:hypothetical protein